MIFYFTDCIFMVHSSTHNNLRKLTTFHCYNTAYLQHGGGNRW